ncbi:hypothetical protein [Aneurinibacillus aneurinilyticus]|uniref:Uncharacterized protein n=1 Tax=Aneurinibacillus aneurinilyticus TaxID=1391 RepID=A0A848D4T7_ANEAE|nr:hypothetical protein [Aneurinibacillus aneurinilyticus]NMF01147.1 hypothetical protein [Aneurinibacillus aneurinilyticus]
MTEKIVYVPVIETSDKGFVDWALRNLEGWCFEKILELDYDALANVKFKAKLDWDKSLQELADWCMDKVPNYTINILAVMNLQSSEVKDFTLKEWYYLVKMANGSYGFSQNRQYTISTKAVNLKDPIGPSLFSERIKENIALHTFKLISYCREKDELTNGFLGLFDKDFDVNLHYSLNENINCEVTEKTLTFTAGTFEELHKLAAKLTKPHNQASSYEIKTLVLKVYNDLFKEEPCVKINDNHTNLKYLKLVTVKNSDEINEVCQLLGNDLGMISIALGKISKYYQNHGEVQISPIIDKMQLKFGNSRSIWNIISLDYYLRSLGYYTDISFWEHEHYYANLMKLNFTRL